MTKTLIEKVVEDQSVSTSMVSIPGAKLIQNKI